MNQNFFVFLHLPFLRCHTAGLEFRDGGTEQSPLLGVFCREKPHTQKSTGNTMYVRYYTNSNNPKLGFYATASIGTLKLENNYFVEYAIPIISREI